MAVSKDTTNAIMDVVTRYVDVCDKYDYDISKSLDELPIENGKWNKYSEECKPNRSGSYLVFIKDSVLCPFDIVHYEHLLYSKGGWAYYINSITHWRELPIPPEES